MKICSVAIVLCLIAGCGSGGQIADVQSAEPMYSATYNGKTYNCWYGQPCSMYDIESGYKAFTSMLTRFDYMAIGSNLQEAFLQWYFYGQMP
jgi:hypothetical protein